MPKVEQVAGARILIVYNGQRVEVQANCDTSAQLLMLTIATRLVVDKALGGGRGARDIADLLRGGG